MNLILTFLICLQGFSASYARFYERDIQTNTQCPYGGKHFRHIFWNTETASHHVFAELCAYEENILVPYNGTYIEKTIYYTNLADFNYTTIFPSYNYTVSNSSTSNMYISYILVCIITFFIPFIML